MGVSVLKQIRAALASLKPGEVRELAERPFLIGLLASTESAAERLVEFLLPPGLSEQKRQEAGRHAMRVEHPADFASCDFGLVEAGCSGPAHFYPLEQAARQFVNGHEDLWIPVARHFVSFREPVVERLIRRIARENALFSLATAFPNIAPSFLSLPWAVAEFASDTAILTVNQIRLAFLIAAASDAPVGYLEQRGQIASIVASAFGWRALARELVSKVPLGGGLVAKGAVAYAGTSVVGLGLERYLRVGRGLTAREKREQYARAYDRGRQIVNELVAAWK